MGSISTTDARGLYTKMVADVYKEMTSPTAFLRSFFPSKEYATKLISIEVQRGLEKVAVDVIKGSDGNRNTFSKSTEKIFEPPYYREFFDITELDLYDRLTGSERIDVGVFSQLLESTTEKLRILTDKIERAYELQCSQVLETGIVQLISGVNIDFKRKAGSLVDKGAGAYWATSTVNPYDDIEAGCTFLRQVGKTQGSVYNAIMGSSAFADFLNNAIVKAGNNMFNLRLDAITPPQRDSVGSVLHGQISAGSYKVNIWTYPEYYDNSSNVQTPYLNAKKVIILPESPRFQLAFAAVPQLLDPNNPTIKTGAFIYEDYIDQKHHTHEYHVRSAGVALPVGIDQIYTVQVVA